MVKNNEDITGKYSTDTGCTKKKIVIAALAGLCFLNEGYEPAQAAVVHNEKQNKAERAVNTVLCLRGGGKIGTATGFAADNNLFNIILGTPNDYHYKTVTVNSD